MAPCGVQVRALSATPLLEFTMETVFAKEGVLGGAALRSRRLWP